MLSSKIEQGKFLTEFHRDFVSFVKLKGAKIYWERVLFQLNMRVCIESITGRKLFTEKSFSHVERVFLEICFLKTEVRFTVARMCFSLPKNSQLFDRYLLFTSWFTHSKPSTFIWQVRVLLAYEVNQRINRIHQSFFFIL